VGDTGRPLPGTITPNPPLQIDTSIDAGNPLLLSVWVSDNREELEATGKKSVRQTNDVGSREADHVLIGLVIVADERDR
jgi:hypothetical protein